VSCHNGQQIAKARRNRLESNDLWRHGMAGRMPGNYDPLGTAQGVPGPKRDSSMASSPQATQIARKEMISMTV